MSQAGQILIIEDDPNIVDVLEIHLNDLGFRVERAADGRTGLTLALSGSYRLILLDIMIPELDGLEVCKRIRKQNATTPIFMLTARKEEMDKVLGLEFGADDYITKPFSVREFIARVKAILRRVEVDQHPDSNPLDNAPLVFGELRVDLIKRNLVLAGQRIDLTAKEFDLLTLFIKSPGRVYNRQQLLDLIWGYQYSGCDHTVNSHINRLRNKIEKDPTKPKYLKTLWGVGYRFCEEEDLES